MHELISTFVRVVISTQVLSRARRDLQASYTNIVNTVASSLSPPSSTIHTDKWHKVFLNKVRRLSWERGNPSGAQYRFEYRWYFRVATITNFNREKFVPAPRASNVLLTLYKLRGPVLFLTPRSYIHLFCCTADDFKTPCGYALRDVYDREIAT